MEYTTRNCNLTNSKTSAQSRRGLYILFFHCPILETVIRKAHTVSTAVTPESLKNKIYKTPALGYCIAIYQSHRYNIFVFETPRKRPNVAKRSANGATNSWETLSTNTIGGCDTQGVKKQIYCIYGELEYESKLQFIS